MHFTKGQKIILIGDSITQDFRFDEPTGLGLGYVRLVHDYMTVRHPALQLDFINKGISGDRITDLEARWEQDVIQQQPDFVSISIGVNDAWYLMDSTMSEQVSPQKFEHIYRKLLVTVKEKTNAQLIMMEPTIIMDDTHSEGNKLLKDYVQVTKKLTEEFGAISVALHDVFIQYKKNNPDQILTTDGVHMNSLGRMLMATTWLESVGVQ